MRFGFLSIAFAVGQEFGGVTVDEITGPRRTHTVALARAVAVYVARAELGLSYPELAKEVRYKDHTSAMSAVARVVKLIACQDPYVMRAVEAGEAAAANSRATLTVMAPRQFTRPPVAPAPSLELDFDRGFLGAAE